MATLDISACVNCKYRINHRKPDRKGKKQILILDEKDKGKRNLNLGIQHKNLITLINNNPNQ